MTLRIGSIVRWLKIPTPTQYHTNTMCRLKSLLTVSLQCFSCLALNYHRVICDLCWIQALVTGSHSAASCSCDRVNTSALVSSRRTAVWTVIRADKWSVWCNPNELRCFITLWAQKHYIEHLSDSSYHFIEENYIAIIIVIELLPSPSWK